MTVIESARERNLRIINQKGTFENTQLVSFSKEENDT